MSSVATILTEVTLFSVDEKCKRNLVHPLNSLFVSFIPIFFKIFTRIFIILFIIHRFVIARNTETKC